MSILEDIRHVLKEGPLPEPDCLIDREYWMTDYKIRLILAALADLLKDQGVDRKRWLRIGVCPDCGEDLAMDGKRADGKTLYRDCDCKEQP